MQYGRAKKKSSLLTSALEETMDKSSQVLAWITSGVNTLAMTPALEEGREPGALVRVAVRSFEQAGQRGRS